MDIRNPVIATLVYYDILDYPLTLLEIHKYLVNPARFSRLQDGIGEIKLSQIAEELDGLIKSGIVSEKNGFYFFAGRQGLFDVRMDRKKRSDRHWRRFRRLSKWLALAPYVRGFFASGSFALENMNENSDLDVFIIAKSGRLYTCRFFLWLIASLLGVRRKRFDKVAPGKVCLNHYIADQNLRISHESIYTSQLYANLKPVLISDNLFEQFFKANIWINNYIYNFRPQKYFARRSINKNLPVRFISSGLELLLNTPLGDLLEYVLRNYQQKRIKMNPVTNQPDGRIICNDVELEFHPRSIEKTIVTRYKEGLRRFGIIPLLEEKDSGLN